VVFSFVGFANCVFFRVILMWKEMNCVISVYGFVQVFIWHAKIYLEQGKNKLEIEMIKTKLSAQSVYVSEYS
jgi:hypothetical protein